MTRAADVLRCGTDGCGAEFPVVGGVPVLIDEARSLFRIDEILSAREAGTASYGRAAGGRGLRRLVPSISANVRARENFRLFSDLLMQAGPAPRVLVLGGRVLGDGMSEMFTNTALIVIESDAFFGPRTDLLLDAHDIPFADGTFDGVVAQAVLEHVPDPHRCLQEIARVLKAGGLVYAEVPFIQQVHEGRYDFTRFTHMGTLRLFRDFTEIRSGASCGPGMALAWSYEHFLMSFARSRVVRRGLRTFARFTAFWLKYLDRSLVGRPGAFDAASAYFFLGRKEGVTLGDRELVALYRGAMK